jgi:repressor LexA
MEELTRRQEEILNFIKDFYRVNGMPPTVREISDFFKISSSSMFDHLTALQKKGYLKRASRKSRSLEFTEGFQKIAFPRFKMDIPILGRVAAGLPLLAEENQEGTLKLDRDIAPSEETFALRVRGESMIDAHIMDGDLVLVKKANEARNGEIVVALIGDEATVKTFYKEGDRIRLQPENKTMEPIYVDKHSPEFRILGKVTSVIRRF